MMGQNLAESLGAFRGLVTDSFVPLEVTREHRDRGAAFGACMTSIAADGVTFTEVDAAPHIVERTAATITAGGSGYYKLSLMLAGTGHLVQDGRELLLRPGDLAIYDTSRPYTLVFDEDFRSLIVMFSKDRLDLPISHTEQLSAASLSHEHGGLARVIAGFLSQVPAQLDPLTEGVRTRLVHTSLDLISTLCADVLDASAAQRDPHQLLLQRIYAHIDDHLGAPDLSPGSIADAHFISKRHLHALFREAGTTVSSRIRERRLKRSRADLLDPALKGRTAAAIAARWGFSDAAHFSRAFKAAYGASPSKLRVY